MRAGIRMGMFVYEVLTRLGDCKRPAAGDVVTCYPAMLLR